MPDGPRPAVAIVLLRDDGRMLVIRRAAGVPRPGVWSPPTGRVEAGETHAEAAVRETREELGLDVRAVCLVWQSDTDDGRYRLGWWQVAVTGGTLNAEPAEVADLRWINSAEFRELEPTFPQHAPFFEAVLPNLLQTRSNATE